MFNKITGLMTAVSATLISGAAFAQSKCPPGSTDPDCYVPAPEISALEGTAAIAALAAIVLLTWERRRRQA